MITAACGTSKKNKKELGCIWWKGKNIKERKVHNLGEEIGEERDNLSLVVFGMDFLL